MQKPISPDMHGMLDYSTVLMTAAAPSLLGMSEDAARACYGLAGGYLALSLFTDYDLSVRRMVPFPAHGVAEAALGAALPFLPKLLGFSDDRKGRNFLLGLAGLTAVVASLTDWKGDTRRMADGGASFTEALMPGGRPGRQTQPELAEAMA